MNNFKLFVNKNEVKTKKILNEGTQKQVEYEERKITEVLLDKIANAIKKLGKIWMNFELDSGINQDLRINVYYDHYEDYLDFSKMLLDKGLRYKNLKRVYKSLCNQIIHSEKYIESYFQELYGISM